MSEEILKALAQLFAIITKQDGGVSENEREFVIRFFQQELDHDSVKEYTQLYDNFSGYNKQGEEGDKNKLTSVRDSVKTLGICRKINKTLTQKQKAIVLIKLLELVGSDNSFTAQRMEIINTVSTVFNISNEEYRLIESFVVAANVNDFDQVNILVTNLQHAHEPHFYEQAQAEGNLIFLRVQSVDMYFVKYVGDQSNMLNGFIMKSNRVYLFSHGSTIKPQSGKAFYYSDLVAHFNQEIRTTRLSFEAKVEEFRFANGAIGLRNVHIAEGPGKLIGIMGASGAGKTTLLNVMAGLEKSDKTIIRINGINIHKHPEKIHGAIGYVPQDDLLIEELTVYQNLYFNAKLCFKNFTEAELEERTMKVLTDLGLESRKDLPVGNALNKTISGGQRKRLNIALELIREPAVLFLDEPTSGLSSRDSENVIDLLKELSLKGKLIFVVIHQPSSDIYKMFDKMIIMDTGGYPVYYGNPVEAVTYFKKATHQADSNRGQCEVCGNVNPEQLFNIIEARVVDEYGQSTSRRKLSPSQWHELYATTFTTPKIEKIREESAWSLQIPDELKQAIIFAKRDFLAKLANKQYLLINLLEAPLLAAILALVIRYRNSADGNQYFIRFNENIPAFILMSIIVALFMGLTVSAEEIIRDRKILKRESFLNLSWNSYLASKLSILFSLSAVQTLLFVVVSHFILGIHGMMPAYWLILFSTSCFANVLGLNISSAFNSAVTVYVIIPLLLIPQMILSGTMFSFDKLNDYLSTRGKVPVIADLMVSRWAYEAIAVHEYRNNAFQREFYSYEQVKAAADFKAAYIADELRSRVEFALEHHDIANDSTKNIVQYKLATVSATLRNEPFRDGIEELPIEQLVTSFNTEHGEQLLVYLSAYRKHYQKIFNDNSNIIEKKLYFLESNGVNVTELKNHYFNESLSDLVRNINTTNRIAEFNGELIQLIDPVYQQPRPRHILDYRTAFYFAEKNLLGMTVSTYAFNLVVIWAMCALLYITLYTEALRRLISRFEKVKLTKTKE
jgi:ABC-type multidrug transport system ATPase subunit